MWSAQSFESPSDSKAAADRFVQGALRRLRIRSRLSKLLWEEELCSRPKRSIGRELQELWPSLD